MPDRHLAQRLADLALETASAVDSPRVQAAAVRTLVDWFAVTIGGATAPAVVALRDAFETPHGDVRLLGRHPGLATAETAALIHGTAAHALELDDIYAPGLYHPGAPTIAAALAAAERTNATGERFVRGVVAGVEVGCRIAADLGQQHYRHWHSTGTVGAVGAAVAVAIVRGATAEQIAHAIAIAGTMASGLQQTFRRDGAAKPLHAGHAAQSGVVAAFSAIAGITGALDVLEGPSGLAVATGVRTRWSRSSAPLDGPLCIEELTIKAYPCCGHTFAAIDAARTLRERGIDSSRVRSLTVETYTTAVATAGIAAPSKPTEARFSIPFTVATMLERGRVDQASFDAEGLEDPRITELLPRIAVRPHADFDDVFPTRRGARIVAELHNGGLAVAEQSDRLGSPENPITAQALRGKFDDLVGPALGDERANALRASLDRIFTLGSVLELPLT